MLSYTFSKREKVLLLALALMVVGVAWFVLVYQGTANRATELDSRIAETTMEVSAAKAKVAQVEVMKREIENRKEAGAQPTTVPDFDNVTSLMAELNRVLGAASSYSISFDPLDMSSSSGYALRGIEITFDTSSFAQAESIVESLVFGSYSCSVDSLDVNTAASSGVVSTTIHLIYVERL